VVARKIDPDRKYKRCSLCKEERPRDEFYENQRNRDGMASMCKECQSVFSSLRVFSKMDNARLEQELQTALKKVHRLRKFLDGTALIDIARDERKGTNGILQ